MHWCSKAGKVRQVRRKYTAWGAVRRSLGSGCQNSSRLGGGGSWNLTTSYQFQLLTFPRKKSCRFAVRIQQCATEVVAFFGSAS